MPQLDLKKQVIKSTIWSGIRKISTSGFSFFISILLARLLSPKDFGSIALVYVVISFSLVLADSGFGSALIQQEKIENNDLNTVFILNIIISFLLYILFYTLAPVIANFYNNSELTTIIRILCLTIIIRSLYIVNRSILYRNLHFKALAIINFISTLISGLCAFSLAYAGYGIWSLVWQQLILSILQTIGYFCATNYIPSLLKFSFKSLKKMYKYSYQLTFSVILDKVVDENIYPLVIGKVLPITQLGFYNRGYAMFVFPTGFISGILPEVLFPALSKIKNDFIRVEKYVLKNIAFISFLLYPTLILMFILSPTFIATVLGDKWFSSIMIVQIFCFAGFTYPFLEYYNIFMALGKPDKYLKIQILRKFFMLAALLFTFKYGINVIVLGQVTVYYITAVLCCFTLKGIVGTNCIKQIQCIISPLILSTLMGSIIYVITIFIISPWIQLILLPICGILIYILLNFYFKTPLLIELINHLKTTTLSH